ncbi:phenylacetate--CoA ligase family protein [Ammoniphilus sp. 3BR4]|uniref:phenylacetate--CoA ligase family protein n=1 Tax=Ammoniphilus sp. 3BR4 TaxID=3158265 RepID=UPI003466DBC5
MKEHLLQEVIRHAYENSTGWKQRLDEAGVGPADIEEEEDLTKIPVLRKESLPMLQKGALPFGGLTTLEAQRMVRIFMSPGPIYDPQAEEGDFWRFGEALQAAGFGTGDIVQNTFSYHLSPAGFMFDSALRSLGCTVIPAGVGNTDLQLQLIQDCGVTGYVGTPSFLATLLEKAKEKGLEIIESMRLEKAFFTAEPLLTSLRKQFESYGIQVSEGYGTADIGCIAYQMGKDSGLKVRDTIFLQICDPETGVPICNSDVGEIVVTLLDKSYPLIRFGTGDLSRWVEGRQGERIAGVVGRVGDGVKVRGMFVYQQQIARVLRGFAEIEHFDALVSREGLRDTLMIRLETRNVSPSFMEMLTRLLKEELRVTPEVEFVPIGALDRGAKQLKDVRVG